jgi:hypothetical protein
MDTGVASPSFRERLVARLASRLAGKQPILTVVTAGELAQWTKLRHWACARCAPRGVEGTIAVKYVNLGSAGLRGVCDTFVGVLDCGWLRA